MPDILSFDGSCSPNPGGRITLGWQIVWGNDGKPISGREELPPHPSNTVNTAEYQALLHGVAGYVAGGGRGPLVVRGDSQLVINQMRGSYQVRGALVPLARAVREALASASVQTTFEWVRREQNSAADSLTHAADATLPAPAQRVRLPEGALSPVSDALRTAIARVNALDNPSFADFARLKVGGADAASRLGAGELQRRITSTLPTAGVSLIEQIQAAFPDDARQQAAVLRWVLRGLAGELAIKKGQADAAIASRADRARGSR